MPSWEDAGVGDGGEDDSDMDGRVAKQKLLRKLYARRSAHGGIGCRITDTGIRRSGIGVDVQWPGAKPWQYGALFGWRFAHGFDSISKLSVSLFLRLAVRRHCLRLCA